MGISKIEHYGDELLNKSIRPTTAPSSSTCLRHSKTSMISAQNSAAAAVNGGPYSSPEQAAPHERTKVRFGTVGVRVYDRALGDHPDVRVGPPMTLSWKFSEHAPVNLEEYEKSKPPRKLMLRMNSMDRKKFLKYQCGVTEDEILAAEVRVAKTKAARQRSAKNARLEKKLENFAGKIFGKKR